MRWSVLTALLLCACTRTTQLLVIVTANTTVPVVSTTVEVHDATGALADGPRTFRLDPMGSSFAVLPRDGDPARVVTLVITGVASDGSRVARSSLRTAFLAGQTVTVHVELSAACDDHACAEGTVCRAASGAPICEPIVPPATPDGGPRDVPCSSCDDGLPCTADACDAAGRCTHAPIDGTICNGGMLRTCAGGVATGASACDLGCDAAATHCRALVPSNAASASLDFTGLADVALMASAGNTIVIDTNVGSIEERSFLSLVRTIRGAGSGVVAGIDFAVPAGAGVATLRTHSVMVAAGTTVSCRGSLPLVFVTEAAVIDGSIYVGCGAAAGGMASSSGSGRGAGHVGSANSSYRSGAGGGSFGGRGGMGGAAGGLAGGTTGPTYGTPDLVPLLGGSSGAGGVTNGGGAAAPGGDSGGALQITATRSIHVSATGIIDADGGFGFQGEGLTGGYESGGSGAGSGGAVLLESPHVTIDGAVGANGGSGGQGAPCCCGGSCAGAAGMSGSPTRYAVPGPPSSGHGGGGGAGSDASGDAASGLGGTNGGGGGGGAGRIRINTATGSESYPTVRPAPSVGVLATTP